MEHIIRTLIEQALAEDIGPGDVTSSAVIPEGSSSTAETSAKQELVLAGVLIDMEAQMRAGEAQQKIPRDNALAQAQIEATRGETAARIRREQCAGPSRHRGQSPTNPI